MFFIRLGQRKDSFLREAILRPRATSPPERIGPCLAGSPVHVSKRGKGTRAFDPVTYEIPARSMLPIMPEWKKPGISPFF
jgi:hypothetical protein